MQFCSYFASKHNIIDDMTRSFSNFMNFEWTKFALNLVALIVLLGSTIRQQNMLGHKIIRMLSV